MKVNISLAQLSTESKNLKKNLVKSREYAQKAKERSSDILIFPEMWLTCLNNEYNNKHSQNFIEMMESVECLAKEYSIWIGGSLPSLNENNHLTNAFMLFSPEGSLASIYRKVHLFSTFREDRQMSAGKELTTFNCPFGKCGFAICYDLRFPELFRSYALQGVKAIFLVAAFPRPRLEHWKTLIRARAIENQLYMICVNRVGSEEFPEIGKQTFFGSSMIVNPWGDYVILGSQTEEMLLTAEIDLAMVDTIRNDINIFKDRKPDVYKL
jgi:omega-amidase